ncbi:hypothetical protein H310_09821 [Aphanomyces invadans]|uniref:BTB domain-containing protein n=1 Tax=Aphanomyces invadans TaxID=157072 RepID=A0A024TS58_9STRA|nr:hypothetical protein H310_09821 [Aphanomyces invadans]ETV96970.1 hypothetical protein H310_09821 [Aphanomyces invadans]RHY22861.1 hypothetical protein DYB32_009379 [Aphanomyces invadans]|eukprot:XP_008874216.1 hypothetical protein H310_09821 [Aphanomyces invadans]
MARTSQEANQLAEAIRNTLNYLLVQVEDLKQLVAEWNELQDNIKQTAVHAPDLIMLNVGGTTFETSKDTLLRVEGSYFHALLESGAWQPDSAAHAYFLDMNPTLFRRVVNFLHTGTMLPLGGLSNVERNELQAMMEYLKLPKWDAPTQQVRWSSTNKHVTVSNDFRTVEMTLVCSEFVTATEALTGTFQLRIDAVGSSNIFGLFARGRSGYSLDHHYICHKNGAISINDACVANVTKLQVGDVVTIQRCATEVVFVVNDGPAARVALVDPNARLFPFVYMNRAAKFTVVD